VAFTAKVDDEFGAGRRVHVLRATGGGAMAESFAPGINCYVNEIRVTLSSVGATAEDITVDFDANAGAAYDHNLITQDMNTLLGLRTVYTGKGLLFNSADQLDFAYTNTDVSTWGIEIEYTEIPAG
jgi:hypothetical protein